MSVFVGGALVYVLLVVNSLWMPLTLRLIRRLGLLERGAVTH